MGAAAIPLMAFQAFSTVYGASQEAKAIKQKGEFDAQQYDFNARMAEIQAGEAIKMGEKNVSDFRQKISVLKGAQMAALSAQGIDVSKGSAASIMSSTSEMATRDVETIKNNAWKEAFGFRSQVVDYEGKARFVRMATKKSARNTLLGGFLDAGIGLGKNAYSYSGGK